ncbi:MAG: hypothetical protein GZ091_10835 [Paludibacter sp.]|nr:hypothetical protein [Paludibacter sp.]
MKKLFILFVFSVYVIASFAQIQLKAPGVKWDELYSFDKCNVFKIKFFAKNNELMRTMDYKIYYQSSGQNFEIKLVTNGKGSGMETVIDKKNEVAIQIFGLESGSTPYYNAGGYKFPAEADLKKLEILPTTETKQILGFNCKKYTYTYKKIFGEVWITDQVELSNDLGIFRAAKMASLHNTLSIGGFVMEMTTEDAKGGKTIMSTVVLKNNEKYLVDLKSVDMNTAINKVNYFTF